MKLTPTPAAVFITCVSCGLQVLTCCVLFAWSGLDAGLLGLVVASIGLLQCHVVESGWRHHVAGLPRQLRSSEYQQARRAAVAAVAIHEQRRALGGPPIKAGESD